MVVIIHIKYAKESLPFKSDFKGNNFLACWIKSSFIIFLIFEFWFSARPLGNDDFWKG